MSGKQNGAAPRKQGILYAISTGKNNGVYLTKDISYQNHKSLKLLTKQAQQSHKSYVNTLNLIERQRQTEAKNQQKLKQVQNFVQNYDFDMKNLNHMKNTVSQYGYFTNILQADLSKLREKITQQNNTLTQAAIPALRSLKQKIKASKQQQMATYSKMHRQLQKIDQCFNIVASGIKQCDRRLEISEFTYKGTQRKS